MKQLTPGRLFHLWQQASNSAARSGSVI